MSGQQTVESHGTPRVDASPVNLPCQGPACGEGVLTYLTEEDIEAHETVQVLRHTPETDDERIVRYFFCSEGCHADFFNAVESGEREETLYNDESVDSGERSDE